MQNFVAKYIEGKKPLIVISLNPEVYAKVKDSLFAIGAEEITDEYTWWKLDKWQQKQNITTIPQNSSSKSP